MLVEELHVVGKGVVGGIGPHFLHYTNRSELVFVILLIFMKREHANSLHRKKDDAQKTCKMDVIKACFLYSLD